MRQTFEGSQQFLQIPSYSSCVQYVSNVSRLNPSLRKARDIIPRIDAALVELDHLHEKKNELDRTLSDKRHRQGLLPPQILSEGIPGWLPVVCYLIPVIMGIISFSLMGRNDGDVGGILFILILWPLGLILGGFVQGKIEDWIGVLLGVLIAIGVWIYVSQRISSLREHHRKFESEITHAQSSLNDLENRIRGYRDTIQRLLRDLQGAVS